MKRIIYLLSAALILFIGCESKEEVSNETTKESGNMTAESHYGKVVEKIDAGSYSYLLINEDGNEYWIAVPTMQVEVGEQIFFSKYMKMNNFRSETLDRTFESVLFVDDAMKSTKKSELVNAHSKVRLLDKKDINVDPLPDGKTVGEIYSEKESLKNSTVKVKGKVVKFNAGIMNRNWIHIQDGTGDESGYDLLVTSNDLAAVGDIIIAEGILALDKDFGAGYYYSVVLENSKVSKE
ncbi:MAG: DNA-binding protein [Candidatus Kariarchaeaceae archaeon]|jgi:hypothetical protein